MSKQRIVDSLTSLFAGHRLVFWDDAEGEFDAMVASLPLAGVKLVRLDETPALRVKLDVENSHQSDKWLFYSPAAEPEPALDWLLDLRLRGKSFSADSASILLEDLGLQSQTLRAHLKARAKFFAAKERLDKLKPWVTPTDSDEDLDRKMLAVLVKAEQPELFSILLRLFSGLVAEGRAQLDSTAKGWQDIVSNGLEVAFWAQIRLHLGYEDAAPSLRDLLFRVLVTDFSRALGGACPGQLGHFILPDKNLGANAAVFASRWRSDIAHFSSYDQLSHAVADELGLDELLMSLDADALVAVQTFQAVEQRIIQDLRDRIIAGAGADMDTVRQFIARRRDGHWANPLLAQASEANRALAACFDALEAAAGYFELRSKHGDGFSFASADAGLEKYRTELYRFDQLYRRFNRASGIVEPMGWALLHKLRDRIEQSYSGWFMPQLASAWGMVLEGDGLLSSWKIPGLTSQQDFYARKVKPLLDGGIKRIFVIISDALRFEVAEELLRDINSKNRFKAELSDMLGVLPSYTGLGMAALLPHDTLAYKLNSNLDLMTNGSAVASLEQRNAHLKKYGGVAIKAEALLEKGKAKGREFVRDCQLIYIYHDRIDFTGDKQASETKTFEAVDQALRELNQLASFIINSLNGSTIFITADHGFIYQEAALEAADKASLDAEPAGTKKAKKRYLLGQNIGDDSRVWSGNTALTAGTTAGEGSLDFWLAKGASRFYFSGGARFVHGSAMPQEILVPLIALRVSESDQAKTRQVKFSRIGAADKVVMNKQRFEFIQTEAVSERVLACTVLVSLRDGDTLISDELALTFDSTSQLMDERKRSVILTVQHGRYDALKDYFLVARDSQNKIEVLRIPMKVNLAFANDF